MEWVVKTMAQVLSELDDGEVIVHFSKDQWHILHVILDEAYYRDVEVDLERLYGAGAALIFLMMRHEVAEDTPGFPNRALMHEYISQRQEQGWADVT